MSAVCNDEHPTNLPTRSHHTISVMANSHERAGFFGKRRTVSFIKQGLTIVCVMIVLSKICHSDLPIFIVRSCSRCDFYDWVFSMMYHALEWHSRRGAYRICSCEQSYILPHDLRILWIAITTNQIQCMELRSQHKISISSDGVSEDSQFTREFHYIMITYPSCGISHVFYRVVVANPGYCIGVDECYSYVSAEDTKQHTHTHT